MAKNAPLLDTPWEVWRNLPDRPRNELQDRQLDQRRAYERAQTEDKEARWRAQGLNPTAVHLAGIASVAPAAIGGKVLGKALTLIGMPERAANIIANTAANAGVWTVPALGVLNLAMQTPAAIHSGYTAHGLPGALGVGGLQVGGTAIGLKGIPQSEQLLAQVLLKKMASEGAERVAGKALPHVAADVFSKGAVNAATEAGMGAAGSWAAGEDVNVRDAALNAALGGGMAAAPALGGLMPGKSEHGPRAQIITEVDIPSASRASYRAAKENPGMTGAELAKAGGVALEAPTSMADQMTAATAGWDGRFWFQDTMEGAAEHMGVEFSNEFAALMAITTRQRRPEENAVLALTAMELRRRMEAEGRWPSPEVLANADSDYRDRFLAQWIKEFPPLHTEEVRRAAGEIYLDGIKDMGAQKSPSFYANLMQGANGEYGFLTTNDRIQARMAGIMNITEAELEPWGGDVQALLAAARDERASGLSPFDPFAASTAPALTTMHRGLVKAQPGKSEAAHLVGVHNAMAEQLSAPPAQVAQSLWHVGRQIFAPGEVAGMDWLLGLKSIDEAIDQSGGRHHSPDSEEIWRSEKVRNLASRVRAADPLADGSRFSDRTRDLAVEERSGPRSTGLSYRNDKADVTRAADRGAFAHATVSLVPTGDSLSPAEQLEAHRRTLDDARVIARDENGRLQLRELMAARVPHEVLSGTKMVIEDGIARPVLDVQIRLPDLRGQRAATAMLGSSLGQGSVRLEFPDRSGGAAVPTLDVPTGRLPVERQFELAQGFAEAGLHVAPDRTGERLVFLNRGEEDPGTFAERVRKALGDAGLSVDDVTPGSVHMEVIEPDRLRGLDDRGDTYDDWLARFSDPARPGPSRPVPGGPMAGLLAGASRALPLPAKVAAARAAAEYAGGAIFGMAVEDDTREALAMAALPPAARRLKVEPMVLRLAREQAERRQRQKEEEARRRGK